MDAKEIRTYVLEWARGFMGRFSSREERLEDAVRMSVQLFGELTAQLAELNATLREEVSQDAIEEITSTTPAQDDWKCECIDPTPFAGSCSYCRGKL